MPRVLPRVAFKKRPKPIEPEPRTVAITVLPLTATVATPIVNAARWLRVTVSSPSSGVKITDKKGDAANGKGAPVSTTPTQIDCAPGTQLYATGDTGSEIAVILQPLPIR